MIRLSTRTHGILDLVYGAVFLAAPFILKALADDDNNNSNNAGGSRGKATAKRGSTRQPVVEAVEGVEDTLLPAMGATILAQGLMTDHEFGAVKALSMPAHLTMDLGLGAFMVAAPWVLNMDKRVRVPMAVLGAASIGIALMTRTTPSYRVFDQLVEEPHSFVEDIEEMIMHRQAEPELV